MNATTRFIEDATDGGYVYPPHSEWHSALGHKGPMCLYLILLDKDAWIAVGKTRGWNKIGEMHYDFFDKEQCENPKYDHSRTWPGKWHLFIDHLADGKNINQSLSALEE